MIDSWEFNKIAGAVLSALLVMVGTTTFIQLSTGHRHVEPGFKLPVTPAAPEGGASAAAPAAFDAKQVLALLPNAKADAGQAAFKKCATCHTPAKDGKNGTGPNLWGLVGRHIGGHAGFNYSEAVKTKGGEWTFDHLAAYLHDPKGYIPGNKMAFAGVKDNAELADLLVYLRTLSDSPAPLPN